MRADKGSSLPSLHGEAVPGALHWPSDIILAATVSRGFIHYQALGKELCMLYLIFSSQLSAELDTPVSSFWRQGNEESETLRNLSKDTELLRGQAAAQIQLQCWIISDLSVWVLLMFFWLCYGCFLRYF